MTLMTLPFTKFPIPSAISRNLILALSFLLTLPQIATTQTTALRLAASNDCEYPIEANVQAASCAGTATGAIELRLPIGIPLHFRWTGPNGFSAHTPNIDQLEAGLYQVLVTYEDGRCFGRERFRVTSPKPVVIDFEITSAPCDSEVDGCLMISGGTSPYQLWIFTCPNAQPTDPQPIFNADGSVTLEGMVLNSDFAAPVLVEAGDRICGENIPPATYYVLAVDQNRCWALEEIVIEINGFSIRGEVTDATCAGEDGAIDLSVFPKGRQYYYAWSNGATTEDLDGLSPGVYEVQVYDTQDQCTAEATFVVRASTKLELNFSFDPYGEFACVDPEGRAPFEIRWTSLDQQVINYGTIPNCIFDLRPGIYLVEVNDAAGCSGSEIFIIEENPCRGGIAIVEPAEILSGQSTTFALRDWQGEGLQWQFKTEFTEWLDIPGATSASYPTPPIHVGSDKTIGVRAVVTCADGSLVFSEVARLWVKGTGIPPLLDLADDRQLFSPKPSSAFIDQLVSVYPNLSPGPVSLIFNTNRSESLELSLVNMQGKIYENRRVSEVLAGRTEQFDLTAYPSGWYWIRVRSAGQVHSYKILYQGH